MAQDLITHTLSLVNDTPGVITIKQGQTPLTPMLQMKDEKIEINIGGPTGSSITMSPLGMKLQFGLPGIGSEVSLGPKGISLSFGPPGAGDSISLGPMGVALKSGPLTKIQLDPACIAANAGGQFTIDASAIFNTAKMVFGVTAPITDLG